MPVSRTRYEKRLPEQFEYKERLELEPYMHNEIAYYPSVVTTGSSTYMPANWNTTYANGLVYNGGSIQWNPSPVAAPPVREKTPMEWLDEQVNAVCRRSGL